MHGMHLQKGLLSLKEVSKTSLLFTSLLNKNSNLSNLQTIQKKFFSNENKYVNEEDVKTLVQKTIEEQKAAKYQRFGYALDQAGSGLFGIGVGLISMSAGVMMCMATYDMYIYKQKEHRKLRD
jgi:hypothetical protein